MTPEQLDRLIVAAERFALAWEKISQIAQEWYDSDHPSYSGLPDAEVFKVGDPHQEPKSKAEYRDFPGDGPGRFQTIIDKAHKTAES